MLQFMHTAIFMVYGRLDAYKTYNYIVDFKGTAKTNVIFRLNDIGFTVLFDFI